MIPRYYWWRRQHHRGVSGEVTLVCRVNRLTLIKTLNESKITRFIEPQVDLHPRLIMKYYLNLAINCSNWAGGSAPEIRSTSEPFLKIASVGMERILYC